MRNEILILGRDLDHSRLVDDARRTAALFDDADDPGLATFLLLDVLAVRGRLLSRQTDQQSAGSFSRVTLQQLEHVTAGLRNSGHFRNHRQVVDDERYLVLLMGRQRLGMAEQPEAGHVGRTVRVVLVHQTGRYSVQPRHRIHCPMVRLAHVLLGHDQLDAVPSLRLVQPLVCIDGDLCSEGLRKDQHVPNDRIVWHDEFILLADGRGHPADGAPRIDNTVATGYACSCFQSGILVSTQNKKLEGRQMIKQKAKTHLEATHNQRNDNVPFLLHHLRADGQQHEHIVALGHSHGVEIAQHVSTCNLAHHVRVVDDRIEKVRRLHHAQTAVPQRNDGAVEPDTDAGRRHRHVRLVRILHVVLLQRRDQFLEHLLRDLATATLKIGKACQPERCVQVVCRWVEGTTEDQTRVAAKLQLRHRILSVITHNCFVL
uniref:Uncharacterized protein n=1 Tax=Anopheles atroparvus TaxID=41427 RepID=A0AAG5DA75_ANOAO